MRAHSTVWTKMPIINWAAPLLSCPAWLIFLGGFTFGGDMLSAGEIPVLTACLVCSPAALILSVMRFRKIPGIGMKLFWILWTGIPTLFGVATVSAAILLRLSGIKC